LAIEEAHAKSGPGAYEMKVMALDDGTATARQHSPAQVATPRKARDHSMQTAT
jgi:hypothetical protein